MRTEDASAGKSRGGRTRWIRVVALVAFSSLSVALLVLWMTIQHVPSWYRPLTPDRESVHRAQIDTATLVDWISEKMVEGEQFEIILHDRSVNEWLAALPHTLPDARRSMPPGISEPIVRFDRDGILIAARCSRGGWEVIASLIIEMNIPDNEDHLSLTLRRVFGGSLPVPDMAVEAMLEPLRELNNPVYTVEPLLDGLRSVESVEELFEGVEIRNRFIWPNGRREFRIDSITMADGAVRLVVSPV